MAADRSRFTSQRNIYNQADLGNPESEGGFGSALLKTAVAASIGLIVYRGMRGAGFVPFGKTNIYKDVPLLKFFRPLSEDVFFKKPINIPQIKIPFINKTLIKARTIRSIKSVKTLNVESMAWAATEARLGLYKQIPKGIARKEFVEQLIANQEALHATSAGLRGAKEGAAHLLSRTITAIPEALDLLGLKGLAKKAEIIPKWILGGTPTIHPGFGSAPKAIQDSLTKAGFKAGSRTPWGVAGRIMSRVVLPAYVASLGYNYLDYRVRRAKALDNTPLNDGITVAGANMWVKSRMFMQKNLERVGVLNAHKYMQTQFPGYLRVAGLTIGAALGIKDKRGYLSTILRSFVGGAAGYAAEKGLDKTPEQLEKIYSGEQNIAVRSGRWWEFGRTGFEGGKVSYYRQHWYPLLKSRYEEKGGLYSDEDSKWKNHWLIGPLTGNKYDPYAWEKEHYKERPYPVTSGVFEDVPLIGPTLDATLGRLIKPRKLMHTEEWGGIDNQIDQPDETERIRRVPVDTAERLGMSGIPRAGMGEVISPTDIRGTIGEQQYRLTEFFGLPGFFLQEAYRGVSGEESLYEQARLQSSSRATGFERNYWDRDLGGMVGTTEIFRRFFPHRRRQIKEYNPIENLMGKEHPWLPGPEYFVDFKHGDPFIKVPMGEARLPGGGYEALNELHSNVPGVYDAVDRLIILADVAPYSDEYKNYRTIVNAWSRSGSIDRSWQEKIDTAKEERTTRMRKYDFQPKRFSKIREQVDAALTNDNETKKEEGSSLASRAWENLTHALSNAPIPGISFLFGKINPRRDPIEHYERFQVFGTESASWANPIRDFAKVYYQEGRGKIQPNWIPPDVQKRRDIEEYFDKIEYIKDKQLAKQAQKVKDYPLAKELNKRSKETLHGLNPYGSWQDIFRAMPRAERDYFESFSEAAPEERERISELVPNYMRRIYEAQWQIRDRKAGVENESKRVEKNDNKDLSDYFAEHHLPGPNWLGWHPDVDLEKVKLKVVKNEALNIHDFNLWRDQESESKREPVPFIRDFRTPNPQYDTPALRRDLIDELTNLGFDSPDIEVTTQPSDRSRISLDFDVDYDQSDKILQRFRGRVPVGA